MGKISDFQTAGLDTIIGQPVTVRAASFEGRTDPSGKAYTQTVLTLDDGRLVRSSSAVVADTFARVPDDGFPVGPLVFETVKSTTKGHADYIRISDAD